MPSRWTPYVHIDSGSWAGYARCVGSPFLVMVITIPVLQTSTTLNSAMRAPYRPNILDNCLTCRVREEHLFCNLPVQAVHKLNEIKSTAIYPKSATLL